MTGVGDGGSGWRRMLWPLVPAYAGVIAAKGWMRTRGLLPVRRLGHPVISVGSLSAGGAGKTPVVMMLAELLAARGFEVRVLTRGYGRAGRAVERVVLDANGEYEARRFGDEPVMIARRVPVAQVWVGADRWRAGSLAEAHDEPGRKVVYLLDDGFQHRKLARDVDVVVLTRQDLTDELLPAGNLREPLRAMQRADLLIVREEEGLSGEISGRARTWFIRRELRFAEAGYGATGLERAIAFCGLARPQRFFAMVANAGVDVAAVSIFRDHHVYTSGDIDRLVKLGRVHGAKRFVTTEKDAVKLSPEMREQLGVVAVAELQVELRDAEARMDELVRMIAGLARAEK